MMLADIGQYLQEKGAGTVGTDLFIGYFPTETPNDCVALIEDEGPGQERSAGTETPVLQVAVRFKTDYAAARERLETIHRLLKEVGWEDGENPTGIVINGRQYFMIQPVFSGITHLEDEPDGRMRIAKNYMITKEEE